MNSEIIERWSRELSPLYNSRELQNMWRILHRDYPGADLNDVIDRLKNKEPFSYIMGEGYFYCLPFHVNPDVLLPRPETEELVAWILADEDPAPIDLIDIGTGSGCIPVALAHHRSTWNISALDISEAALDTARKNAARHEVAVHFLHGDARQLDFPSTYDVIVCNPPYITVQEQRDLVADNLRFEPHVALFTNSDDELFFYRIIGEMASKYLKENGRLYLELNEFHARSIGDYIESLGYEVEFRKDMQDKWRMLKAW